NTATFWAKAILDHRRASNQVSPVAASGSPVRKWVDRILARFRKPNQLAWDSDAVPVLEELLGHPHPAVRLTAALALNGQGVKSFAEVAPVLFDVLLDAPDEQYRFEILVALAAKARADPQGLQQAIPESVRPALLTYLDDCIDKTRGVTPDYEPQA